MAFTEAERVSIRKWMGYPALYLSVDARFESAITSIQSLADGGSRPDNSTELAVRGYLAKLAAYEARWVDMLETFEAATVDEVKVDAARAQLAMQAAMRLYVGFIADVMDLAPRRDVLTPKFIG